VFYLSYLLDKKGESDFLKGKLINVHEVDLRGYEESALKNWELFLGMKIHKAVVIDSAKESSGEFDREGIVYEFAKLKTNEDIGYFANKYGLLGVETPSKEKGLEEQRIRELQKLDTSLAKDPVFNSALVLMKSGKSYFEPVEIWKFQIEQIKKLLKLYRTLVNIHAGTEDNRIECNLLSIGKQIQTEKRLAHYIEWWDGSPTGCLVDSEIAESGDFLRIAREVLVVNVSNQSSLRYVNNIAAEIVETDKPPLGFVVQETRTADYLINAIYYDLWNLISKNEPVSLCDNPACRLPFKKSKRKHCNDGCKQEAYRIRTAKKMHDEGQDMASIAKKFRVKLETVENWISL
jgi:hypothetical protein